MASKRRCTFTWVSYKITETASQHPSTYQIWTAPIPRVSLSLFEMPLLLVNCKKILSTTAVTMGHHVFYITTKNAICAYRKTWRYCQQYIETVKRERWRDFVENGVTL